MLVTDITTVGKVRIYREIYISSEDRCIGAQSPTFVLFIYEPTLKSKPLHYITSSFLMYIPQLLVFVVSTAVFCTILYPSPLLWWVADFSHCASLICFSQVGLCYFFSGVSSRPILHSLCVSTFF